MQAKCSTTESLSDPWSRSTILQKPYKISVNQTQPGAYRVFLFAICLTVQVMYLHRRLLTDDTFEYDVGDEPLPSYYPDTSGAQCGFCKVVTLVGYFIMIVPD